jgi:poly(3-hydroxybutyrate) depolymerase
MEDEMFAAALLAVTTLLAGNHRIDLTFGGLQRSYIVHVPAGVSKSAPVVINLHGGGSNAEQQQKFSGMDAVADREHFIVVYPNGTGSAPVSGSIVLMNFHSTHPVPVMHFHSVDDPRALYFGGLGPAFPGTSIRNLHPPVEEQLAKWIGVDGCRTTPSIAKSVKGKPGTADEGNTATKLVYAPCSTGANVVLWKLSGSGHVWPGRDIRAPRLLGRATHLVDANEEIWAFFQQAGAQR